MKNSTRILAAAALCGAISLAAIAQVPAGWRQHSLPATDATTLLALAGTPDRDTLRVLYMDVSASRGDGLKLVTIDEAGTQRGAADLGTRSRTLHEQASVVLNGGGALVATTDDSGAVRLMRLDERGNGTSFGKPVATGGGTATVSAMLLARSGNVALAGTAGGKGFVALLSPRGEALWSRTVDDVAAILGLVESDQGFIVAGGTPGATAHGGVRLARLAGDGTVLASETRPGPTRHAHLASDGGRIGLLYEALDAGLETGSVILELFASTAPLRPISRQALFTGRLAAPFVLAGGGGRFTAAGVAEHGRLQVIGIDAAGKQETLFHSQAKAPDYTRFHSVAVARGRQATWIAGLRSRADGRRRQYDVMLARIPDR